MILSLVFVLCAATILVFSDRTVDVPIVITRLGQVKGSTLESCAGQPIYAFRGIRYAQPPVGNLRFQPPQPAAPWEETLNATQDGPMCPQVPMGAPPGEMSEDCLFINVYTKQLPDESVKKPSLDVLVFIHPGGFQMFSGHSQNMGGPEYLLDNDIILVTFNYRLGSLGFLSTGTADCPGNYGLKDQVMALKWVRDNIASFGGNPESVTLMGYSAGGFSVTLHMISPMSAGLFHRAIVMSGSSTSQVEWPKDQSYIAQSQAKLLGCDTNVVSDMMGCLRQKSVTEFMDKRDALFASAGGPLLLWKPVVEPDFGQERFLDRDPTEAFMKGDFMKIPVIAGMTRDEFAMPAIELLNNETMRKALDENFEAIAPIAFWYQSDTRDVTMQSRMLREKTLGSMPISKDKSLQAVINLFTDAFIGFGMHRFVQLASRHTKVYQYEFSYVGRYSFFCYPDGNLTPYGAAHHDDLLYLFTMPWKAPRFNDSDPEATTIVRLTRMWSAFCMTGDPNQAHLEGKPNWLPVSDGHDYYLNIAQDLMMEEGLFTDRYATWDEIFPLPKN